MLHLLLYYTSDVLFNDCCVCTVKLEIVCILIAYYVITDMLKSHVHSVWQGLSKDHGDLKEK